MRLRVVNDARHHALFVRVCSALALSLHGMVQPLLGVGSERRSNPKRGMGRGEQRPPLPLSHRYPLAYTMRMSLHHCTRNVCRCCCRCKLAPLVWRQTAANQLKHRHWHV